MNLKRQTIKNVGASWLRQLVSLTVGFFLAPFVLHKLGDDQYGLWVLLLSVFGYYGLFDFGIRSAVVKYVAEFNTTADVDRLRRTINTIIFMYSCIGLAIFIVIEVGSFFVGSLFHLPPDLVHTGEFLFRILGVAAVLLFPLSVFTGILQGLHRFDWLNLTQIVSNLVRAMLIVLVLTHDGGLLSIALVTLGLLVVVRTVCMVLARRLVPLKYGRRLVDRATFHRITGYSSITFLVSVAEKLRFGADVLVIGIFLSPAAITFFAIGSKLVDYASNLVDAMADTFLPMASQFDSARDSNRLRRLFVAGNRASALVIFPICGILIVMGKPIISVWMGPKYISSYIVLLLLLIPRTLYRAQAASNRILFGMYKHKVLGIVVLAEGICNLILSIILVRHYGIIGVALGTTIPLVLTSLFFLPLYLCQLLQTPLKIFLVRTYMAPLGLSLILVSVLWLERYFLLPHTYIQLAVEIAGGAIVYAGGLFWLFLVKSPAGTRKIGRFVQLLQQALSR